MAQLPFQPVLMNCVQLLKIYHYHPLECYPWVIIFLEPFRPQYQFHPHQHPHSQIIKFSHFTFYQSHFKNILIWFYCIILFIYILYSFFPSLLCNAPLTSLSCVFLCYLWFLICTLQKKICHEKKKLATIKISRVDDVILIQNMIVI